MISGKKMNQNVENVVGLMTTAGKKGCEVHVSLSQDPGKLLTAMHKIKIAGESDLLSAIQIARLALRHRQNKRQEQRICLFVGSPVTATEKELSNLGGQLKKNKVAIDIVSFGEENAEENQAKLEALYKAANNADNCHFVTIPPGSHMLSDMLQRTPIVRGDAPDTGVPDEYDGSIDPELAEALRLSMLQAETDSKNRELKDTESGTGKPATTPSLASMEEDPELAEAIRMSMLVDQSSGQEAGGDMVVEEDDELAAAIRLSRETANQDRENDEKGDKPVDGMAVENVSSPKAAPQEAVDMSSVDPEYMSSLFLELPGIDPNDPEVQALLSKMKSDSDKKDEKK
jgi:26S proteasome regulatory subunit N10